MIQASQTSAESNAARLMLQMRGTDLEADLAFLTRLAARLCAARFAFVSLLEGAQVLHIAAFGANPGRYPRELALCALALEYDGVVCIPDLRRTGRATYQIDGQPVLAYGGAVLTDTSGQRLGTLCVMDPAPEWNEQGARRFLGGLARQVAQLLEFGQLRAARAQLRPGIRRCGIRDELTGVLSRRSLLRAIRHAQRLLRQGASPYCLCLLNLDQFRRINAREGYEVADLVLRTVGGILSSAVYGAERAGRLGGDEFCLLLPGAAASRPEHLMADVRAALGRALDGHQLSLSVGLVWISDGALRTSDVLRRANQALAAVRQQQRGAGLASAVSAG